MIDVSAISPERIRPAEAPQLKVSRHEMNRMANRVEEDLRNALSDHQQRMNLWREIYRRWRGRSANSEFLVPITQWHIATKWAKEHAALFGDDADIAAKPIGPSDQRNVNKAARYMKWLVFDHMKLPNKAAEFNFRKTAFGRAFAYAPWTRDTFQIETIDGEEVEAVHYEGPGFDPLWPDDVIVPAEDVRTLHDFSFLIRRTRRTPDQLLEGEGTLYQGITENWEAIYNIANDQRTREDQPIQEEKDIAEGVLYDGSQSATGTLTILEWYGRWHMLKGKQDGKEGNFNRRRTRESELVIRYCPELNLIVGVQNLAHMYPLKKNRRPFVEASLLKDGAYWSMGFGELLESIELELSSNHNLASKAGKFSVGPIVFYRPGSGFNPDNFEYEPFTAVPTDDPSAVKPMQLQADLNYPVLKEQIMNGYGERVTGQSDMNMGRAVDRPNAPKTARQTIALLEEGDIRASLDTAALREDWGLILEHFWDMTAMFAPKELFFRVTEEDAGGLFQVQKGGAYLTEEERFGRYDFSIKFATTAYSKASKKEEQLALYQIDLQNPLIIQNPRALWILIDKVHKAFGDDNFAQIIPEPPDLGLPVKPSHEWSRMQAGEEVIINPLDPDQLHILEHQFQLREAMDAETPHVLAIAQLKDHLLEHTAQFAKKQLMETMAMKLAGTIGAAVPGAGQLPGMDMQSVLGGAMQDPAQGMPLAA